MELFEFIGRERELKRLKELYDRKTPTAVVIKGRRRIGKSRLIKEFASTLPPVKFWSLVGVAPIEGVSAQDQRDNFAKELALLLKIPPITFYDWTDAFEYLSLHLNSGDIILFDEISWMGDKDPTFIPKLKNWWDRQEKHVLFVFCGSVSTWIEENILNSTAFFGRINATITLDPLSITESSEFLKKKGIKASYYDTYKILTILGGVPWYLEQLSPQITIDENIKQLALRKDGLLVSEFDRIFNDLFNGKGATYRSILEALKDGMKTLAEIREEIKFSHSGTLTSMMGHLIAAGFVQKQNLWSFKTTKPLKQSLYRISDPYMRFYLKFIEPNLGRIASNSFDDVALSSLAGFETHIGLQLEYLLIQNRALIIKALGGVSPQDIICDGPYRQSKNSTQDGCQVDYLIQTATRNLFICEFKFNRRELGTEVMEDMKNKIKALKVPRGFAVVPVLFHVGGVVPAVETANYFYRIVDITYFLD